MTGLFFGSFNPVHNGHLAIARYLLDKGFCREVWFVVSPQNPLKQNKDLLDEDKRLEIIRSAIAGEKGMKVCDIEFRMPRPSYTWNTLQTLEKNYPEQSFALVIGEDNLRDFHLWRNYEEILRHYRILVYPRPGVEVSGAIPERVTLVNAPLAAVSSTEIRAKAGTGEDISGDVPAKALPLIIKYYAVPGGTGG